MKSCMYAGITGQAISALHVRNHGYRLGYNLSSVFVLVIPQNEYGILVITRDRGATIALLC